MIVPLEHKINYLIHFLKENQEGKIICYFLTCALVEYIYKVC